MFYNNSRLKKALKRFFEKTLDFIFENNKDFPKLLAFALIILYFLQILSYCFKPIAQRSENLPFLTLSSLIIYSNPWNVLQKLDNSVVFWIFFAFMAISLVVPFVLLPFVVIIMKKQMIKRYFFSFFLVFHYFWLIFCFNDLLFSLILGAENNFSLRILCIFLVFLNNLLGFSTMSLNRSVNFLENGLKVPCDGLTFLIFVIRTLISLSFHAIASETLLYFLTQLFFFFSFCHFFRNYPLFTNDLLNRCYLCMLFFFEIAVICVFSSENLGFFAENSVFYVFFLSVIPALKLGNSLVLFLYKRNIYNCTLSCFFLEELYAFSQDFQRERGVLNLQGLIKAHQRRCKEPMCERKLDFSTGILSKSRLEAFIKEKFELLARLRQENHEKIVLKYLTFLNLIDFNPIKCYYDLQKLESRLKNEQKSLFFATLLSVLKRRIRTKIKGISLLQTQQNLSTSSDFFEAIELQTKLEVQLKSLLKQKALFWENYCSGISTMSELFAKSNRISHNIHRFLGVFDQEKAFKKPSFSLLKRKMLGICHVVLTNRWDLAYKNEEEFANLTKSLCIKTQENLLGPTSFLDSGLATCLVSFMRKEGCFLTKSEALARFFGYSQQDFQGVTNIYQLMPRFLAEYHGKFFRNYVNQSKKELENRDNQRSFIDTYAVNRENHVFPIRIFTGFHLKTAEDFVMTAGFLKTHEKNHEMLWLFDKHGKTVGVSKQLSAFFASFLKVGKDDRLENLNLLPLIAKLRELIAEAMEKSQGFVAKNQTSSLILPEKFQSLLRVLREKEDEERDFERYSNYTLKNSVKSLKTQTLNSTNKKQKRRYLTNFTKNFGFEDNLQSLSSSERELTNLDLIELVVNRAKTKKFAIFFDFKAHFYRIDDDANAYKQALLPLFTMKIHKISENGRTLGSENDTFSQKQAEIAKISLKMLSTERVNTESAGIPELPEVNFTNFNDDVFRRENVQENQEKVLEIAENHTNNPGVFTVSQENIEKNTRNFGKTEENIDRTDENFNKNVENFVEEEYKIRENELFSSKSNTNSRDSARKSSEIPQSNQNKAPQRLELRQNASQSSVFSEMKRSFLIFDTISRIKSKQPSSLKKISLILLIQLLLTVIYSVSLSQIYGDYETLSYKPIQKELISFCTLIAGLELTFILMTDIEYLQENLLISNRSSQFQRLAYWQILNDTFNTAKELTYDLRNSRLDVPSIHFYRELIVSYADESLIKTEPWPDFIEYYVKICYDILKETDLFETQDYELQFLQRNFPYYVSAARILKVIEGDFLESNAKTTENAQIFMISLLISSCFLILFILYEMLVFHRMVSFLMNIFRRVSSKEAVLERNFLEEMLIIMKQPFLHVNFLEKSVNKASVFEEKAENFDKAPKRNSIEFVKEKAKVSRHDFKQMSRVRIFLFATVFCLLAFVYYFFNYYYWVLNNDNIQNLIQLNIFFENLYIYSTSIVGFSVLYIREMLIRSPKYEASGDIFQNHAYRLKYFYPNYYKRILIVNDITAHHMLEITSKAKTNLKDAAFDQLVSGNICELLEENQQIIAGTYNDCEQFLNGAFKKGVISLLKEFLNEMTLFQNYADFMVIPNDSAVLQAQIQRAKEFINSVEYRDLVNSHYYLTKTILSFYEKINGFYYGLMETQMNGLKMFLVFTSIAFAAAIFVIAVVLYRKLLAFYFNVTLNMEIIPYERISSDEQTKFLIKQFLKKFD